MKRFVLISLCLMNALPVVGFAADAPLKLSMSEAIKMAAEKNLDVRAEFYTPAQFEADIKRNRSIYDPLLTLQTSYGEDLTKWSSSSDFKKFDLNTSLSQLFWTGGTASLSFGNSYTDVSSSDRWQTKLGMSLSQPILKNSGREATESAIMVSRLSKYASIEKLKNKLVSTIAQVRSEYFKLYFVREQLEVKKVSLELARKILTDTKARVSAGVLPAMEILNAEFGAVSREKELIEAERAVDDQMDVIRLLLQIDGVNEILTTDLPQRELLAVSEDDAIKRAKLRPEIREQKRNLEMYELQTRVYNGKTQPDLAFVASAGLTGADGTYQRNLEKVGTVDNPVWSIGLTLSYPLGNNAAENDYRKSRLKLDQTVLQIRSLEESAANEVKASLRSVATGYKQIEVAERGRVFAEERLRAFIRKNEVGLATTKDVLDVENDLAAAKSTQISALVSYNNAITRFWQVTGDLLEREGVTVVEGDIDKLYSNTFK